MPKTLYETATLTTDTCAACGVLFAMPETFVAARRRDRATFYCPNGHTLHYPGETPEQALKRAADREAALRARTTHLEEQLAATARSNTALRGAVTKAKRRAAAGVCPAGCQRHFADLQRHMASQHPDHAKGDA